MASALSQALREAAEQQRRMWSAYERIYAALGYSEMPAADVIGRVARSVEAAALALGTDQERVKLFRARKAIEQERAVVVAEEEPCSEARTILLGKDWDPHRVREALQIISEFAKSRELVDEG
jgi:hypothetical protein